MSEDKDIAIICMRVSSGAKAISTATITTCSHCHHDIYIAPSSLELMADTLGDGGTVDIMCVQCAVSTMEAGSLQLAPLTPSQVNELRQERDNS